MAFGGPKLIYGLLLATLWSYFARGEVAERAIIARWATLKNLQREIELMTDVENPFVELFSKWHPHPPPVGSLNLSDTCADDVQFWRDSRTNFDIEAEALKKCAKNDTDCQNVHSAAKKQVSWVLKRKLGEGGVDVMNGKEVGRRAWWGLGRGCSSTGAVIQCLRYCMALAQD